MSSCRPPKIQKDCWASRTRGPHRRQSGEGEPDFLICTKKKKKMKLCVNFLRKSRRRFSWYKKGLTLHLSATPLTGALFVLAQVPMNYLFKYLTGIVAARVHRRLGPRAERESTWDEKETFFWILQEFYTFLSPKREMFFLYIYRYIYTHTHTISVVAGLLEQQNALCLFCGFVLIFFFLVSGSLLNI